MHLKAFRKPSWAENMIFLLKPLKNTFSFRIGGCSSHASPMLYSKMKTHVNEICDLNTTLLKVSKWNEEGIMLHKVLCFSVA